MGKTVVACNIQPSIDIFLNKVYCHSYIIEVKPYNNLNVEFILDFIKRPGYSTVHPAKLLYFKMK